MRKVKKHLTVLIATALLASLFTGCSRPTLSEGETIQNTVKSVEREDEANFNPVGYPIVDEPITLRIAVNRTVDSDRKSLSDIDYLNELAKKTNINIEWIEIGPTAWNEKKNLMFVSGDLPDAFLGEGISDMDILTNVQSFVPMNDLIEKYAPNIKACFDKEPELKRTVTSADGSIYSLFRYRGSYFPNTMDTMGINKNPGWIN